MTAIRKNGTIAEKRQRTRLFGIDVDVLDLEGAVDAVLDLVRSGRKGVVVTTNLDHALKLRGDSSFRKAYDRAELVTADGMPFVWLSNLSPPRLPERVTGSDMILPLCRAAAREKRSVFFLGSTFDDLRLAAHRLADETPGLDIAGVYAPPFGFEKDPTAKEETIVAVNAASPDILMVALGAPKQEIWATENLNRLNIRAALCIGAGLDFLSGKVRRAPKIVRRAGVEWLWRVLSEPRRLGGRYLRILLAVPILLADHFRDRCAFGRQQGKK